MEKQIIQMLGLEFALISFEKPGSEMLGIVRKADLVNIKEKGITVAPLWVNAQLKNTFGAQFENTGTMHVSYTEMRDIISDLDPLAAGNNLPHIIETLPGAIEKLRAYQA